MYEGEKKLSLKNDYVFKRVFGKQENERITKALLEEIIESKISNIEIKSEIVTEKNLVDDKVGVLDIKDIIDMDSKALILKVYEFNDVVELSALKKEPHLITNYVYELASMLHNYYGKHRILTDDINISSQYLGLIKTVKITIKNALRLIGVSAPDKM